LRGADRGVKAGTVVADQREVVAALEALFRKAAGERSYFVGIVLPAPGLPDAEILLRIAGRAPRTRAWCISSFGNVSTVPASVAMEPLLREPEDSCTKFAV